jgi:dihydrofolate synthase/folylpolyglutamate synthase
MTDATDDDEFREAADAVYETLLTRLGEGSPRPRLAPTRRAVELLGDPQRAYPIIHVTGTNGKTSTSRVIESILRAYGLRVGLFTSPHLLRFNERFMIDGQPISDEALARNWDDVAPYIQLADAELAEQGEQRLTFFEVITVLAFACFADAPVDVAVIEVGMGGEWDSTNVGDGQVAVFTPISLDHTERLGSTIAEIAARGVHRVPARRVRRAGGRRGRRRPTRHHPRPRGDVQRSVPAAVRGAPGAERGSGRGCRRDVPRRWS